MLSTFCPLWKLWPWLGRNHFGEGLHSLAGLVLLVEGDQAGHHHQEGEGPVQVEIARTWISFWSINAAGDEVRMTASPEHKGASRTLWTSSGLRNLIHSSSLGQTFPTSLHLQTWSDQLRSQSWESPAAATEELSPFFLAPSIFSSGLLAWMHCLAS